MASSSVSHLIDAAERSGKLSIRTEELAAQLPGTSDEALRHALQRLRRRGRIVRTARRTGHWLLVPLQDSVSGAPPLESWLHQFMTVSLQEPYYVGFSSAAEAHGASPYAVMVTQVVVSRPRRPLTVGRHELQFIVRKDPSAVPTQWHETASGRFLVSTPEATTLELVARQDLVGGAGRVLETLRGLAPALTVEGLYKAFDAIGDIPSIQRLGTLLNLLEKGSMPVEVIADWLRSEKRPKQKWRQVPLTPGAPASDGDYLDPTFKVRIPAHFTTANT